MSIYSFGKLKIDPAVNPAVLNTGSWDVEKLKSVFTKLDDSFYQEIVNGTKGPNVSKNPTAGEVVCYASSIALHEGIVYAMVEIADKQTAFVVIGSQETTVLNESFLNKIALKDKKVSFHPTTDRNLNAYTRYVNLGKGPRALGAIPRLGIGVRHSAVVWPGIYKAMYRGDFSANAIQNSVRELHLLETLTSGTPSRVNHLFSFGPVKEGHAGSTFEGLYTQGVIEAIKFPERVRFGADADHLQVKRGTEGIERTKKFIDASRYYSFYTLDVSDILDYDALSAFNATDSTSYLESRIPSKALRNDVLWYHKRKKSLGKQFLQLDEAQIGRFVGKYWHALDEIEKLFHHIDDLKAGEKYDMELSIDENPPHVKTFDTVTTAAELLFLVDEIERRGLPITHLAPNFGVEKGVDYRGFDGKEGFERRLEILHKIASEKNMMLDCHSGDDLSRETRRIFKRATRGNIHFKISPSLQSLVGEVVEKVEPTFFRFWWEDTLRHTKELAASDVPFAKYSLNLLKWANEMDKPSSHHLFFKEFCYATLGERDNEGQFVNRDKFYSLSEEFQSEMDSVMEQHLMEVAGDLFEPKVSS
jgi:hypothetical protein